MLVHTVNIQDLATKFFLEYRNSEQSLGLDSECKSFQAAQGRLDTYLKLEQIFNSIVSDEISKIKESIECFEINDLDELLVWLAGDCSDLKQEIRNHLLDRMCELENHIFSFVIRREGEKGVSEIFDFDVKLREFLLYYQS